MDVTVVLGVVAGLTLAALVYVVTLALGMMRQTVRSTHEVIRNQNETARANDLNTRQMIEGVQASSHRTLEAVEHIVESAGHTLSQASESAAKAILNTALGPGTQPADQQPPTELDRAAEAQKWWGEEDMEVGADPTDFAVPEMEREEVGGLKPGEGVPGIGPNADYAGEEWEDEDG